jgi:restriction endonuclease S subunit
VTTLDRHWKMVKFGDIVENVSERVDPAEAGTDVYVGLEHLDPSTLHLRQWGHPSDVTGQKLAFKKGDVIFGRRRAYQRKLAVAEFDGICSAHAMVVRAKAKMILPEFLPFFLQSDMFMERAIEISVGSLSPTINWKTLRVQEFPLPTLDEQKRIAEILWAADEAVNAFTSSLSVVQQSRNALLNELAAKEHPKMPLGQVLTYASDGPFGSKLKTEHYSDSGAIVVRLQNISPLRYDDSDKAYIPINYFEELRRYSLHAGDILVAGLGDEAHPVGRACIVPESLGPAINKADCFCLRPRDQIILPDYLCYFLNSSFARKEVMRITQGTTRFRINVSNLKTINTVVPGIKEQRCFVQRMKQIDICEKRLEGHLRRSRQLARNLLPNMMFGGDAHV